MVLAMQKHQTDVMFIQETNGHVDEETHIYYHLLLTHGTSIDRKKIARGGIGFLLSPNAQKTWKAAGQPNPIRAGKIAHTARIMGIILLYKNHKGKHNLLFIITYYFPCTGWSDKDFARHITRTAQNYQS